MAPTVLIYGITNEPGTYPANEGTRIQSIRKALEHWHNEPTSTLFRGHAV
jgi:hypothetical protein